MVRAPIIPEGHAAHLPLPAHGVVVGRVDVIGEEIEELVGLDLLQLGEPRHESRVDVQRFEARDGMGPDGRVVGVDGGSVGSHAPEVDDRVVLEPGGMDRVEGLYEFSSQTN